MVLGRKFLQEYLVKTGSSQGSILGPSLFQLYIKDLPDDVICNISIYADNPTLYFKCDKASDLREQLDLASELKSDPQDTGDWSRKWLFDSNAEKLNLFC